MSEDIEGSENLNALLDQLKVAFSDAERKRILGEMTRQISAANRRRITANVATDGTPFTPRKIADKVKKSRYRNLTEVFKTMEAHGDRDGIERLAKDLKARRAAGKTGRGGQGAVPQTSRGKRIHAAMFAKIKKTKWLKYRVFSNSGVISFFGGNSASIARVHHYGLRQKIGKKHVDIQYPERPLLGISAEDEDMLEDILLKHFSEAIHV